MPSKRKKNLEFFWGSFALKIMPARNPNKTHNHKTQKKKTHLQPHKHALVGIDTDTEPLSEPPLLKNLPGFDQNVNLASGEEDVNSLLKPGGKDSPGANLPGKIPKNALHLLQEGSRKEGTLSPDDRFEELAWCGVGNSNALKWPFLLRQY